jgi:LAO/AO transport system kinase
MALLDDLLPHTGSAVRIGISGAPGVGKSTFIEAFGVHAIYHGHRVAVLAVDPSSVYSRGSILGDKTRMEELSRLPDAYIRPSPSGGALGGVARRTREAMLVCEAAGFDVVIIETVGVGQSETSVADMVDEFVLLISPGGGDDLQGIKRGITELADIVVVTKADGDLLGAAQQAAADYSNALHLLRPKHDDWTPRVLQCSAVTGTGIDEVAVAVVDLQTTLDGSGALARIRADQAVTWFWSTARDELVTRLLAEPGAAELAASIEADVRAGRTSPAAGAGRLLEALVQH